LESAFDEFPLKNLKGWLISGQPFLLTMKKVAILGSTGSIGTSCLEVIDNFPEEFRVTCLSARKNVDLLYRQALKYRPEAVVIAGEDDFSQAERRFNEQGIRVFRGREGLVEAIKRDKGEMMVNALVGSVGLLPTIEAIRRGKEVALANKETLVMAGELIMSMVREKGISLIPIDSEHSAIFQVLVGEDHSKVSRLILTASGGPFLHRDHDQFDDITVEEALAHPSWKMGKKVTIDSATLMNKGLEVIEAHWLFGIPLEKIEVVIHPQAIIHSMVEFVDGSVKAQLAVPDMRIPIQYALTYPQRRRSDFGRLDFSKLRELNFFPPDFRKFPCLKLAMEALKEGGTAPAVLNASNEVAVILFLERKIKFSDIPRIIEEALSRHRVQSKPTIEDIIAADRWTREFVSERFQGFSTSG